MTEGLQLVEDGDGYRLLNDPDEVAFAPGVLNTADPNLVSFREGVLTLNLVDGDRLYRWTHDEGRWAHFSRVRD